MKKFIHVNHGKLIYGHSLRALVSCAADDNLSDISTWAIVIL